MFVQAKSAGQSAGDAQWRERQYPAIEQYSAGEQAESSVHVICWHILAPQLQGNSAQVESTLLDHARKPFALRSAGDDTQAPLVRLES